MRASQGTAARRRDVKSCRRRQSDAVLKPEITIWPSGISTRSASRNTSCGLAWNSSTWGSTTRSTLCEASGNCSGSAAIAAPGSSASVKRKPMRFCRRKSTSGRPTCTARKPNTSSTALSYWASSQRRTYSPCGVDSHPESDERPPPLYFCAPFCTKECRSMLQAVSVVPVAAFKDNYVWTLRNASHAAVVDPGAAGPVLDYLQREGLSLAAILATHHHPDHVGGIAELRRAFEVPVYGPKNEPIATLTRPVSEGDRVAVPELGVEFSVLDIPGHTRAHIAYYGAGALFCGDTLFACGCGRLFEGTAEQMYASLDKLARLPDETRVYCGHEYTLANIGFAKAVEPGNKALRKREERDSGLRAAGRPTLPSTLGDEKATNPFLRCLEPAVVDSVNKYLGSRVSDPVRVFAAIRDWKNRF